MRLLHSLQRIFQPLTGNRPASRPRQRLQRLTLESLETREVPSCTQTNPLPNFVLTCDYATDTIILGTPGPNANITVPTSGGFWAFPWASVSSIVIRDGGGNDTVRIEAIAPGKTVSTIGDGADTIRVGNNNNSVQDIKGTLNISNPPDFSFVTVDNSGDTIGRTANHNCASGNCTLTGLLPGQINYVEGDVNEFRLLGGAGNNTWNFLDVGGSYAGLLTRVFTGPGNDVINVQKTRGSLYVVNNGNSGSLSDIVNLGNNTGVSQLNGWVHVSSPSGQVALNVNDGPATTPRYATLMANPFLGELTLLGMSPAMIQVEEWGLRSLNIYGGSGADTFVVVDTAGATYATYTQLTLGPGNDTVYVLKTAPLGVLSVDGGPGNDFVRVGSTGYVLDDIWGTLNVFDGQGINVLMLNDQNNLAPQSYLLTSGTVTRSGIASINYRVQILQMFTGDSDDDVTVFGNSPLLTQTDIMGGTGTNYLYGPANPNANTTWTVTGPDRGTLTSPNVVFGLFRWADFGTLIGNGTKDIYVMAGPQAGLSGYIWDQGGLNNTLDYSAFPAGKDVYVNLNTAEATNISFGVYGIQDVNGGAGDDILVGDWDANILYGWGGQDLLIGGMGLKDKLYGVNGDDILLAGTTGLGDWNGPLLKGAHGVWKTTSTANKLVARNFLWSSWLSSGAAVWDNGVGNLVDIGNGMPWEYDWVISDVSNPYVGGTAGYWDAI